LCSLSAAEQAEFDRAWPSIVAWYKDTIDRFANGNPTLKVRLHGVRHYVYINNESEVVREMRKLLGLPVGGNRERRGGMPSGNRRRTDEASEVAIPPQRAGSTPCASTPRTSRCLPSGNRSSAELMSSRSSRTVLPFFGDRGARNDRF
jgi:hypothetical protein